MLLFRKFGSYFHSFNDCRNYSPFLRNETQSFLSLFRPFPGQIKRSMYAFSPVECLDCNSDNLIAAGLGWSKFFVLHVTQSCCPCSLYSNFVPLVFVNFRLKSI